MVPLRLATRKNRRKEEEEPEQHDDEEGETCSAAAVSDHATTGESASLSGIAEDLLAGLELPELASGK